MAESEYKFEPLSPVNDVDLGVYDDAINYVFENADIKNVAISGAYGAGKSSILASYKKKHPNLRFLHISLAHFQSSEPDEKANVKESVLEGKILNQLIHQIPSERIPQTNFRVKKRANPHTILIQTLEIVLFLISIIYFVCFDAWRTYVNALPANSINLLLLLSVHPCALILDGLLMLVLSSFFIYELISIQKNKNIFHKLNIQGNEIEIFEASDDSYFDKYLNEVLYLFENSDADIIVFEDMDRFNASRIFERLREVNTLANIQLKKDDKKVLRFFYLLRDDIFVSKDRTKFFDYIIPVVPVIDSSNSYDKFILLLKTSGLFEKFNEGFLQGLSLYIDDLRLLKNIYNEFVIYYDKLNVTELNCNKMLAIITYKNLFPRDFADLQLNQGFIYTLFSKKDDFIQGEITEIEKEIAEKRGEIASWQNEPLASMRELNAVFADQYLKGVAWSRYDNRVFSDLVQSHLNESQLKEYEIRKQIIDGKLAQKISTASKKVQDLEKKSIEIKNFPLKQIITRNNIDQIFKSTSTNEIGDTTDFNEIKSSEYFGLLKYLIRNGYIDETYADYMTYFYGSSLCRIDKIFLRSLSDKKAKEYTYQLKNIPLIISRLREVDFAQEETLNFDLLEWLLLHDAISENAKFLRTLILQTKGTNNLEFVSMFFGTHRAQKQFIVNFNMQWPTLFSSLLKETSIPTTQIREYSIDTLCNSDDETIVAVNIDGCLANYISGCPDYLEIENPDIDRLIAGFSLIHVSFDSIDYEKSNPAFFDKVYRNDLYVLSFENIALMLKSKYEVKNELDIVHKNYTLVQSRSDSPLTRYISQNMSSYAKIIIDNCDGSIADEEIVAIALLNNSDIDLDTQKLYIQLLSTMITDIKHIALSDLWPVMMEQKIIVCSASNFTNYFDTYGVDTVLINYINEDASDLDFTSTADVFGDTLAKKLFDAVLICNDIATNKYQKALCDLGYHFDNFEASEISGDKFQALIDERILQMSVESLKFVRDQYEDHLYSFIQCNLDGYLALQTSAIASLNEILQIITWDIDDTQKTELLSYSNASITIIEKDYSDAVNAYILTHNLNDSDSPHLYAHYSHYGKMTQAAIGSMAIREIESIIAHNVQVEDKLLSALFQTDSITPAQKIDLFTVEIPWLNEDTCKVHFDELRLSELKTIFEKASGRRNYTITPAVTTVLEALKSNSWIYEYRIDERNSEKYVIQKNKPSKSKY